MAQSHLQFLALPQATFRERYTSELDPSRNRPKRLLRAAANPNNYEYPTIEISSWWPRNKRYYIRITLVTIPNEKASAVCVHPYPLDTPDDAIRDAERNTLFFAITPEDFSMGFKSFRIIRKKLIQHEVRNYGLLRLLDSDGTDIQRVDDARDARGIINTYQLHRSQLVFSLAELVRDNQLPVIYNATAVYSNIMTAIVPNASANSNDTRIRYAPREGSYQGGEEMIMVIPRLVRRGSFRVILERNSAEQAENIPAEIVDNKTISFQTPPCPYPLNGHETTRIPFVVYQNNVEIARVQFVYHSHQTQAQISDNDDDLFDDVDMNEPLPAVNNPFDDDLFDDII